MQNLFDSLDDPQADRKKFRFLGLVLCGFVTAMLGGWAGREMIQGYLIAAQKQAEANLEKTMALKSLSRDKEIAGMQKLREEDVKRTDESIKRIESAVASVNREVSEMKDLLIERLPPRQTRKVDLDFKATPDKESIKSL